MARRRSSTWFSLLGLAFAVAGLDKLFSLRGYQRMFDRLGWTEEGMRLIGVAELSGGLLVTCPWTRRLGGAVLAATSAAVLASELNHEDGELALPRLAVLAAALTATGQGRRREEQRAVG